ncbi:MAG: DUF3445 domain-containing protein [Acidimicrobiales bacterium]
MPMGFVDVVHPSLFGAPSDTFRWRMGVRATDRAQWLQPDDLRTDDLREKADLRRRWPDETFVALPGSEAAAAEVRDLVAADLVDRGLASVPAGVGPRHPLDAAGCSVQEDLCLMEQLDGAWTMTAASVCFPTRWDVPAKLGRSLAEIHAPVPGYDEHLGRQVDRFFDRMSPGVIASRLNWSLVDDPSRRLGPHEPQAPARVPDHIGDQLFVRVERQTLRRLTGHEAVVFGIRVHVWPLNGVAAQLPAASFADELERIPIDVAHYKDLDGIRPMVVAWLRSFTG